jgi:predicted ferric reductase
MRRQVARTAARVSPATQQWLVLGALALGGAFTLYLWWHGSPEGWMDSYMNVANGLAQISGMLGEYLFLVQVLLMARVPLLERALGTELLAKLHTVIGFLVLEFVSVHIVGATYLNARRPDVSHLVALAGVFLGIRDVLLATFGTTFLYLAGYLSTRTLRRRIPYEVWRYLHMLVYIGLALELVHQYTLGPHFLNSMWTSIAWGGMHAVVIVLVAWYRVGFVVRQNLRHRLRVDRVVDEGPGVYSIYLVGHRLEKLHGSAGQFCRFRFLNREGWWQSHPFSLSAAPAARYMRITVKELGDWTGSEVSRLRPGTVAFFSGPYGGLTPERRRGRKVVLIAAGIGITPMRSLLAGLPARPGELTLVYRARSEDDLVFREELDELARQRGATVHYLLGPRGQFLGGEPLGADQLQALIPDLRRHDAYLCGPESMIAAAITGLREGGVPRNRIHSERFVF